MVIGVFKTVYFYFDILWSSHQHVFKSSIFNLSNSLLLAVFTASFFSLIHIHIL